jgi:hypothetical protein
LAVRCPLELLADLKAVFLRDHRLNEDHVRVQAMECFHSRQPVGRDLDGVARADQRLAEAFDASRLVVDEKYRIVRHSTILRAVRSAVRP